MAWSEFYITGAAGASNLNSGSTADDSALATVTNSDWGNAAANRFTAASGTPFSAVTVGMWASMYLDAATAAVYVAKVTAVNAGGASIDLSTTLKYGTAPTTGSTGRSCKVGGAWKDFGIVTSLFVSGTTVGTSTRVNIKAGTYTNTATIRYFYTAGTTTKPLWWRGYKTSPGDQDSNNLAVAGTDIPAITFTTGQLAVNGAFQYFSNLDVTSASIPSSGNGTLLVNGVDGCKFYHMRFANTAANVYGLAAYPDLNSCFVCCYFQATTTASAAVCTWTSNQYIGCVFVGGIIGAKVNRTDVLFDHCVFSGQAGDCIQVTSTYDARISYCSFYSPVGNGVAVAGTPANYVIITNNYFENVNQAAKAAINNTSGTDSSRIFCVGNLYYNCTATISGVTESFSVFDAGTLASAGFTNGAGSNFSLVPAAQDLGFPGVLETISAYRGYSSQGAISPSAVSYFAG